jgi:ribosomal protein L11 methylase PrmA
VPMSKGSANAFEGNSVSGWSPTPISVVTEALRLAEVDSGDLLFDLGCGDGRVVVRAAKMAGARAIGVDIDRSLLRSTRQRIERAGVGDRVRIRCQNLLAIPDIRRASVIFMYLPNGAVNRLRSVLRTRCLPGTRIISVSYRHRGYVTGARIRGWRPDKNLHVWFRRQKWNVGVWIVK